MLTSETLRPFISNVSDGVKNLLPLRVLSSLLLSALIFINQGQHNTIKSGGAKQWLRCSLHGYFCQSLDFFLTFIKLSPYSNLITPMFVISLHVVHFITPFTDRPTTCYFLLNQVLHLLKFDTLGKMENFIQSDCFWLEYPSRKNVLHCLKYFTA